MERPWCKICDEKHWPKEPHRFGSESASVGASGDEVRGHQGSADGVSSSGDGPASEAKTAGKAAEVVEKGVCPLCASDPAVIEDAEKWRRYRNKRRDYMRKRRAK